MKSSVFSEGATGRDIIDEVVIKNQSRNQAMFDTCKDMPPYFGQTNIGEKKVSLSPIKRRDKFGKKKLIIDIIEGVNNLALKDSEASVILTGEDGGTYQVKTHPVIIKFIKTCLACSYNINEDFSRVLSDFAKEVIEHCDNLSLPISYYPANKTQKVLVNELNDYLKELCDENGITYSEVITSKGSKRSRSMKDAIKNIGDNK